MMNSHQTRAEKARQARYKRAALEKLGADMVLSRVEGIVEACDNVRYFLDSDDGTMLNELIGDEDEALEFKMLFSELSAEAEELSGMLYDGAWCFEHYDDCTVAALGDAFTLIGYDSYVRDYFSLATRWEKECAEEAATKRLMSLTKAEIIECFHRTWRTFITFFDLEQRFEHLSATMDILKGDNAETLNAVREIEKAYEEMYADYTGERWSINRMAEKKLDRLVAALPDRCFVE